MTHISDLFSQLSISSNPASYSIDPTQYDTVGLLQQLSQASELLIKNEEPNTAICLFYTKNKKWKIQRTDCTTIDFEWFLAKVISDKKFEALLSSARQDTSRENAIKTVSLAQLLIDEDRKCVANSSGLLEPTFNRLITAQNDPAEFRKIAYVFEKILAYHDDTSDFKNAFFQIKQKVFQPIFQPLISQPFFLKTLTEFLSISEKIPIARSLDVGTRQIFIPNEVEYWHVGLRICKMYFEKTERALKPNSGLPHDIRETISSCTYVDTDHMARHMFEGFYFNNANISLALFKSVGIIKKCFLSSIKAPWEQRIYCDELIQSLTHVEHLDLSSLRHKKTTNTPLHFLSKCKKLEILILDPEDELPVGTTFPKHLKQLTIRNNTKISDAIFQKAIERCLELEVLDISGTPLKLNAIVLPSSLQKLYISEDSPAIENLKQVALTESKTCEVILA